MYETITFNGVHYPKLQSEGYAMQYALPFARKIIGEGKTGYDIGCKKKEWSYPNAILIDPELDPEHDAGNLPELKVDYILSSHMLEHYVGSWAQLLDHWYSRLHDGGVLFLYLPHPVQEYWLTHNNLKHVHVLFPDMIAKYLHDRKWKDIFVTGYDLNCSYYAIARK